MSLNSLIEKNPKNLLLLNNYQKMSLGWVLIKMINPSEKTKKQLNFNDKYQLWWHPETNKIVCDCPGFTFKGKCKHIKEWSEKINSLLSKKQES